MAPTPTSAPSHGHPPGPGHRTPSTPERVAPGDPQEATARYGSALLGILIVQDVALGAMLALLPVLNTSGGTIFKALRPGGG